MSFSLQGHQPWTQGFETSPQIITNGEPIGIQKADQLQAIIDNITSIQHGNIYCEVRTCEQLTAFDDLT